MSAPTRLQQAPDRAAHETPAASALRMEEGPLRAVIFALFFLSGATSLVYEIVWVRRLSLFFGSDVYSAATTLSVFMGGLALGSWLASRFADRMRQPLAFYGWIEIGIGLTAAAQPLILDGLHDVYRVIYNGYFDSAPWIYHGFRVFAAAATMLLPTTLMGISLPLLVRYVVHAKEELGRGAGLLYAINTLGALTGTVGTGFALLPAFGVSHTYWGACSASVLIGVGAITLGWLRGFAAAEGPAPAGDASASPSRLLRAVLLVIALSGMAALALEIAWMRILVQSFSSTVYAFSIMLACFLFGIYYGSLQGSRRADASGDPAAALGSLLLGLTTSVAALALLTYVGPPLFAALVWTLTGISGGAFGVASTIAQIVVASALILGPTILLGATFPFAVKIFTPELSRRAYGTGRVYAANTAGSILGSLLGAFVLLPAFGSRISLLVIAAIFLVAALVLAVAQSGVGVATFFRRPPAFLATAALVLSAVAVIALPPQVIVNYGLQNSTRPEILYHGDGTAHTVDIVRSASNTVIMMVDGNVEADTSLVQRRHFVLKAYLPLLLHPAPAEVSVVGLGLGITLRSLARHPGVERIRLLELSPDMVRAHGHLKDITDDVLANPKIDLRIDDGRNFMTMSDEQFDVITADPIHPRVTGVGYLYTKEYYETIRARLRPGGVVTQWMPMYNISVRSFDVAFRTFAEVFPNASFWYVRGHGLFVATDAPFAIDCENVIRMFDVPQIREDFASIEIRSPEQFFGHLLMDAGHIQSYLAKHSDRQSNSDDNAYLEYRAPSEFLGRTDAIVPGLIRHAGWDRDAVLRSCSAETKAAVRAEFENRLGRMQPELAEPLG